MDQKYIITKPVDKGGNIVIWDMAKYKNKVITPSSDTHYRKLDLI